jgi:hypothetical protein
MASKTAGKGTGAFKVPASTWKRLRARFVDAPEDVDNWPTLREYARTCGVPDAWSVEFVRRATLERWVEEREASWARRWWERNGLGARTEAEFCIRFAVEMYGHLIGRGPEGYALAMAFGRDTWRRAMGPLLTWDAHEELERARTLYDAVERGKAEAEKRSREREVSRRSAEAVLGW